MSEELVPLGQTEIEGAARRTALLKLNEAAAAVSDPGQAQEIMLKGRTAADLLEKTRAPFEETWLAGKASTLAARRLGKLLSELSGRPIIIPSGGALPSERGLVLRELGISHALCSKLISLANAPDPSFQRYIQRRDIIPSVTGACIAVGVEARSTAEHGGSWLQRKKKASRIKTARNPDIDELYSLIVRALGHADGLPKTGNGPKQRAIRQVQRALYEAEDALKPYLAGYDGTGRKAA